VQAILGLIEDRRLRQAGGGVLDLLTVVRRQAVQDRRPGSGPPDEPRVDLEPDELRAAGLGLGLLPHRSPDVRVQHVGVARALVRVVQDTDLRAGLPADFPRFGGNVRPRLEA